MAAMIQSEPYYRTWWQFYRRWLYVAFRHSWSVADTLASLLGLAIPAIIHMSPRLESRMAPLAWQIPLSVLTLLALARLVLAPYWIYKERHQNALVREQELMADLAATSGKLQEIEDAKPILVFRNAYTEIVNVNKNGIVVLTANVLRLKIENASQHHYPNNEAKNVTATISFYDQSNRVLVADMDARWTASTQPVGPHTLSIVPLLGMDFPIGSKRDLDIAFAETTYIKMPIPELVALNNDNFHFQRWRKREHVLPGERFIAKVRISAVWVNTECSVEFWGLPHGEIGFRVV
jgi:hypothetical protein